MNKEQFISSGLLELYATGISSPEETRMVEEYLLRFPELKQELNEIEVALESYAQLNAVQPDAAVKDKILNSIFPEESFVENEISPVVAINKKSSSLPFYKLLAAASIVLLIASMIVNYNFYTKYQRADDALQIAQQKMLEQEKSNHALAEDLGVVTNKYSLPVVLKGTPKAPDAVAKIFWMKNTGEVFIDPGNLPQAPAGRQYQLWAIVDGQPVDAGMIVTEKGTYRIQQMKSFGKAEAFAITLEKAGGSPTPTMDEMVVIGKM